MKVLSKEQQDLLDVTLAELRRDDAAIEEILLELRCTLTERLMLPRLQRIADAFGTGFISGNGLGSVFDSTLDENETMCSIAMIVTDGWQGELLPTGSDGHEYQHDEGYAHREHCRVCGGTKLKHGDP